MWVRKLKIRPGNLRKALEKIGSSTHRLVCFHKPVWKSSRFTGHQSEYSNGYCLSRGTVSLNYTQPWFQETLETRPERINC